VTLADDADAALRERLRAWLAARWTETFGPLDGALELTGFQRLSKGQSSDLMEVSCRAGDRAADYVIRCEPRAKQLFHKPDVLREAEVLKGLERHGTVPVPHVWWTEADDSILGAPFFAMARVEGRTPLGRPSMHLQGVLTTLSEDARQGLWWSAMEAMVAIHALDWRQTHAFLAPEAPVEGYLADHVAKLSDWYGWTTRGRAFPLTDAALDYLKRGASAAGGGEPVLVWNDARVGNMIFGADDRVAAVIDWEQPIIGPAGVDLGYWLMMDEFHAEGIGVERLPGWPGEAETIRRYQALSGRTVGDIDYFIVLAAFWIATTLIRQADIAVEQGRLSPDTRMGFDNTTTQMIARRLGLPVPELSVDFAAHRNLKLPLAAVPLR
jgi:aminoglycoside phosphotransferase (APT) family kinase protein